LAFVNTFVTNHHLMRMLFSEFYSLKCFVCFSIKKYFFTVGRTVELLLLQFTLLFVFIIQLFLSAIAIK